MTACEDQSGVPLEPDTIGTLVYEPKTDTVQRVFLSEDNRYVPFLVLRRNDDGSVLVLREFVLSQKLPYSTSEQEHATYYGGSDIDLYLNDVYFNMLSQNVRNQVLTTQIEVASLEALKTHEKISEFLSRRVFLLSADEVGKPFGRIHCKEGTTLDYFRGITHMKAYDENGVSQTWYLRTAVITQENAFISVAYDGSVGIGTISSAAGLSLCGVRPALCLPSSTKMRKIDNPDGEGVIYIVE